jgi:maltooligosyltrehalose trehalohydrolase
MKHGVEVSERGATFRVWAPKHRSLQLNLDGRDYPMSANAPGEFSLFRPGAHQGMRYAYRFEDGRLRPDPASRRQPEGVHERSAIFDPRAFRWSDGNWNGRPLESLVFYELHLGTYTDQGTLDAAAQHLVDLAELGVTCLELMPVQPFAGNRNWGYDGVFPYAVHEAYGGPEALQRFIDLAHQAGLAVCLDVVFNHLGPEGNYSGEFGPYFSSRHPSPWGDGINYDGNQSGPVREFAIEAALQWVRDFHADALRLDAVHAIADDSPRHIVREITRAIQEFAQRANRQIHVIAESDLNDRRVVESEPLGWGASAMWTDDFHHAAHAWLTRERTDYYADFGDPLDLVKALSEGFTYQGQFSGFRNRRHGTMTAGLAPSRFVFALQNHDQIGNRPHGERLFTLLPHEAWPPLAAILLLGPGLPLLFMGEEYGETRPFLYFTSHSDPALAKAVSEGRRREFAARGEAAIPDPQAVETFSASKLTHRCDGSAIAHRDLYRNLLQLRRQYQDCISTEWPRVSIDGKVVSMVRSRLSLKANLGPWPASGLLPWGWEVESR